MSVLSPHIKLHPAQALTKKPARKITKINKPMPKIRSAHSKATQHTGLEMALR